MLARTAAQGPMPREGYGVNTSLVVGGPLPRAVLGPLASYHRGPAVKPPLSPVQTTLQHLYLATPPPTKAAAPGLCSLGAGFVWGGGGSDWGGAWTMGLRGWFFLSTLTRIRCLRFTVSARDSPVASTCVCGVCVWVGGSFQQPHRARCQAGSVCTCRINQPSAHTPEC